MVNSRDPINQRQAELLARIAAGDTLSDPQDATYRRSARALRSRGLATTSTHRGVFTATITERGRFYLEHNRHPDTADLNPAPAPAQPPGGYHTDPSASDDAHLLVGLLAAAPDKTVWIEDPDEEIRAAYRRTLHAAKHDGLIPDGYVLRHTGRTRGDMVIRLLDADHPDDTDWNRTRLRNATTTPRDHHDLGQLLDENPTALLVSDTQRPRARQFLLHLAAEAERHGHQIKLVRPGQHAKLVYLAGKVRRSLKLREEYDPPQPPAATGRAPYYKPRQSPPPPGTPSGRLRLEIGRASTSTPDTWIEHGRTTLTSRTREIIAQVQAGIEQDERTHHEQIRAQQEWKAAEEDQHATEKIAWQAAMDQARPKAVAALRQATLVVALAAWRDARDMREICAALHTASTNAADAGRTELAQNLAAWRDHGLNLADTVDPTTEPASIGAIAYELQPAPGDLSPHLGGWNPEAPHRGNHRSPIDQGPSLPWPTEWEQLRT